MFQRRKNYRNWLSDDMKSTMKIRDSLREKARGTGCQDDWVTYRQARNQCINFFKECKKAYYESLFQKVEKEKSTKNLYSLAGELMGKKDATCPQQYFEGWSFS